MNEKPPTATPLSIYVAYHPDTPESRDLADHLHDWFRLVQDDGDDTEAGLPIWFRTQLCEVQGKPAISPDIDWQAADLNVVVLLVDDRMVECRRWRQALQALMTHRDGNLMLPVAVDFSLYRLTFLYEKLNPIRIGEPRDRNKAENPGKEADKQARKQRIAQRARLLRRAVTEAITRELQDRRTADSAPVPMEVFLSHAKRDGIGIAEAIRDGLAGFSQMKAWYDANELPPGYDWNSPMKQAAEAQTAVLLSVVTDAYATRYWCRQEVNLARMPRELELPEPQARVSAWTVQPTVAVHHANQWSRPMAQLAQIPRIGWPDDEAEVPARVADIVDRLLLETLLVTFYRRYIPKLAREMAGEMARRNAELVLLSWVPDPWSMARLIPEVRKKISGTPSEVIFAYPGHGLRTAEHRELQELVEALFADDAGPRARLISQEGLYSLKSTPGGDTGLKVLLSGGGAHQDLEPAGIGPRHLNDLFNRLARRLLQRGCTLAYGGVLGNYASDLTQALIETARGWIDDLQTHRDEAARHSLDNPPFINYSAWPYYDKVPLWLRADLTGICEFRSIDPPGEDPGDLPDHDDVHDPDHARLTADALSHMREISTRETELRIVMGGKIRDWAGWLPGIAEEVLCSLEQNKLPLILGGFGGCAGLLAGFLLAPERDWPAELGYEDARQQEPFQKLTRDPDLASRAEARFTELRTRLCEFREKLHDEGKWDFPVERQTVLDILDSRGASQTLKLLLDALEKVAGSPKAA